jgi:hypothetical protein
MWISILILVLVVSLIVALALSKPQGGINPPTETIAEVNFGISGYGLFHLFGAPHEGVINLWPLSYCQLTEKFRRWGPVAEAEGDYFASCMESSGSAPLCRSWGSASAFIGYVDPRCGYGKETPMLLRTDEIGFREAINYNLEKTKFYVRGAIRASDGGIYHVGFFVESPSLSSSPKPSEHARPSFTYHEKGSDAFWVCERIEPLLKDLSWMTHAIATLEKERAEIGDLLGRAASNPLFSAKIKTISKTLENLNLVISNIGSLHVDLTEKISHLMDWVNAPAILRDSNNIDFETLTSAFALEESRASYEEVLALSSLITNQ